MIVMTILTTTGKVFKVTHRAQPPSKNQISLIIIICIMLAEVFTTLFKQLLLFIG